MVVHEVIERTEKPKYLEKTLQSWTIYHVNLWDFNLGQIGFVDGLFGVWFNVTITSFEQRKIALSQRYKWKTATNMLQVKITGSKSLT